MCNCVPLDIKVDSSIDMQHQYEEIVEWYRNLTSDYSKISRFVENIGTSFEGRNIPAVHFTASKSPDFTVYFQCQIHASMNLFLTHTNKMYVWCCFFKGNGFQVPCACTLPTTFVNSITRRKKRQVIIGLNQWFCLGVAIVCEMIVCHPCPRVSPREIPLIPKLDPYI